MNRRQFIQLSSALSLGAIGAPAHRALAMDPWGALPNDSDYWPAALARPNYKVLEIHLSGGLSPYETFHVDTRSAVSDRWFSKASEVAAIDYSSCGGAPASSTTVENFDGSVKLGPVTKPLWPFKDVMRVVVLQHDLEPHEAAIPYSLTGLVVGNPKFAGLGAAMEHLHDRALSGKSTPNAYVLMPANLGIDEDSFRGFFSTGVHGGQFQPLVLRIPNLPGGQSSIRDEAFLNSLDRAGFGARQNDLLRQYAAQYRDRLRHRQMPGVPTRSSEFSGYETALNSLLEAPGLKSVLQTALAPVTSSTSCIDSGSSGNLPRAAIQTAAKLLTLPETSGGARYVGLVDGGIRSTTGGGYDVHGISEYPRMYTNLWNCLSNLAEVIHRPATAADVDPNKINLNDTLVILNTEFGRTPGVGNNGGRDHEPRGYVNVLLGGPITSSGVVGSLQSNGLANLNNSFSATDTRAAVLMAAGIDPFADETLAVGDIGANIRAIGLGSEDGCARALRENILGVV